LTEWCDDGDRFARIGLGVLAPLARRASRSLRLHRAATGGGVRKVHARSQRSLDRARTVSCDRQRDTEARIACKIATRSGPSGCGESDLRRQAEACGNCMR